MSIFIYFTSQNLLSIINVCIYILHVSKIRNKCCLKFRNTFLISYLQNYNLNILISKRIYFSLNIYVNRYHMGL